MGRRGMLIAVAALLLPASAQALTTNQTVLVDRPSGDAPLPYDGAGRGFVEGKNISANGCYVLFVSDSDPLFAGDDNGARNIFRYSRCGGPALVQVNTSSSGVPAEVAYASSAARSVAGGALDFAARQQIAVHGGIGATWEHDAPLTYRRAQLSRRLVGGTGDATDRVADELFAGRGPHAEAA